MSTYRSTLLIGALCAALTQGCLDIPVDGSSRASDPYYDSGRGYDYDDDRDRQWERTHEQRGYSCDQLADRIREDRSKLSEIDPSKHHKAYNWYVEDLRSAERSRSERCGGSNRGWWDSHDREHERERDEESLKQRREHDRAKQEAEEQKQRERQREQCEKIPDRIRNDRQKLSEIDRNKHHKAYQWFEDDIRKAERDLASCGR